MLAKHRKTWPMPFSETQPHFTINEWLRVFAVMWLTYLFINVNNPISNLLFMSGPAFLRHHQPIEIIGIIGLSIGYALLMLIGLYWAGRTPAVKALFAKPRWRDLWYILAYGALNLIFQSIGNFFGDMIPTQIGVNLNNSLNVSQLDSSVVFWTVTGRQFFLTLGSQLFAVALFLAFWQLWHHYLPNKPRVATVLTYVVAAALAGILTTTPENSGILQNMLSAGFAQVPLFWAYRRSRNVLVPTLAAFALNRVLIFVLLLVGL